MLNGWMDALYCSGRKERLTLVQCTGTGGSGTLEHSTEYWQPYQCYTENIFAESPAKPVVAAHSPAEALKAVPVFGLWEVWYL